MGEAISTVGGNVTCLGGRETTQYSAVVFPHHVPLALDVLADTLLRPRITEDELQAEKLAAQYEAEDLANKPEAHLIELAHRAAYGPSTLGLPALCPEANLPHISTELLRVRRTGPAYGAVTWRWD